MEDIMPTIERLTVTMPADMAALIKAAVAEGDYASTSEVIREALRDWKLKRSLKLGELEALRADIDKGMADLSAGRVSDFDMDKIIERGRKLLAGRSPSAGPTPPKPISPKSGRIWPSKSPRPQPPSSWPGFTRRLQLCRHPGIGAPRGQ